MSTRPDTPFEHDADNPYAPRWVRDPSYQVLRRAETLKRSALSAEETEPVPSVPCEEPDLPRDFPPFLMKNQQPGHENYYIDNIRVPPSLVPRHSSAPEHEREPWPHRRIRKRRTGRKAMFFSIAVLAVAGASYLLMWNPSTNHAADVTARTIQASLVPATITAEEPPASTQVKTVRITPKYQEPWPAGETASPTTQQKPNTSSPPASPPRYRVASQTREPVPAAAATPAVATPWPSRTPEPAAAATEPPAIAAKPPTTELDEETVALLIKRGKSFIDAGDLASARVVLRRAAEAGNSEAALAMAGTYDPAALKRLGVKGLAPDPEKARLWYEKARQLGSSEAPQLLKQLANRTN